jgi:hypothetical protein
MIGLMGTTTLSFCFKLNVYANLSWSVDLPSCDTTILTLSLELAIILLVCCFTTLVIFLLLFESIFVAYLDFVVVFLPIVTFFYLSLIPTNAPFKRKAVCFYGFGPLKKVKIQYVCLLKFLFGYVGLQWIEKEIEEGLL